MSRRFSRNRPMSLDPKQLQTRAPSRAVLFAAVFACLGGAAAAGEDDKGGPGAPGGVAGLAAGEVKKRQRQVEAAQTLFTSGTQAFADKSYGEAMDYYKAAFETLPDVPAVAAQRRVFFRRYESAAHRYAGVLAEAARWTEAERTLSDVVALAEASGLPADEVDPEVRRMLRELRDKDDRYNFAASPRHLRNVDEVDSKLILARGYLELGDYDRAERSYQQVLNIDPYNTAARRGLERLERQRLNYYDAAYNHTRSKRLAEVAAGWETPVPPLLGDSGPPLNADGVTAGGSVAIEAKLSEIVVPSLEFENARLVDVVDYLRQKAVELDVAENDPVRRGVNIIIDSSSLAGEDAGERLLSVKLANVPLGVALRYVVEKVGLAYRTDNTAIRVIPPGAVNDGALVSRNFLVPPGFLTAEADPGGGGAPADPFADPAPDQGAPIRRVDAQKFLQDRGIQFGDGATATFVASTNTLLVRNTADQLQSVEALIEAARSAGPKMVQINVKIVSVESERLRQLGLDFLLGPANFGSSPRAFFSGGTDGNAAIPTNAFDFPFNAPFGGPVGTYPVTSGLRTGDVSTSQTIDDVIARTSATPSAARAPGIFSVAGVFTDPQFQMVLRALSQIKGSDLLSDAHVTVRPGQLAKIEQVREFIYPTEYDPPEIPNVLDPTIAGSSLPATPATPTAFETRRLGKVLDVEPTVSEDNTTVSLNVLMEFTEFSGFINYGTPITNPNEPDASGQPSIVTPNEILMPVFDTIRETTNVTVWDGQTVAIGGFHGESITATEDKIPYLGDLPVLGRAFRSMTNQSTKRALTIFVSVRLVDPGGNPLNQPAEEEPETFTRREPVSAPVFAPGPPPVYPAK